MPMVAIPPVLIPEPPNTLASTLNYTTTQLAMSQANAQVATIVGAPATGDIVSVVYRTGTVTTGATISVRAEGVSVSTPDPSGTLWGTNTSASQVINSADDNTVFETTFTAAASVTRGDQIAFCFVNPGAAQGNMQFSGLGDQESNFLPRGRVRDGAGVWSDGGGFFMILAVKYSTGVYHAVKGVIPAYSVATQTYNNTSTPDVRGNRMLFDAPVVASGMWAFVDLDANADVKLMNSAGTVLATRSLLNAHRIGTSLMYYEWEFPTDITLDKETDYFLYVEPVSGSNISTAEYGVPATAGLNNVLPGGADICLATAKDPTSGASFTLTTTNRSLVGLIITQVDDGTAEGGGSGPRTGSKLNRGLN